MAIFILRSWGSRVGYSLKRRRGGVQAPLRGLRPTLRYTLDMVCLLKGAIDALERRLSDCGDRDPRSWDLAVAACAAIGAELCSEEEYLEAYAGSVPAPMAQG